MHIALIPDGNRRYMRKHGILNLMDSYRAGISKFYDFLDWSMKRGVNEVTIYALSLENIQNRGRREIETLYSVFSEQARSVLTDKRIHDNKIRVKICGEKQYLAGNVNRELGKELISNMEHLEDATKDYHNVTLNLAVAYGGRQEVINAVRQVAAQNLEFTEENIQRNLWVKSYPEIVIRTSEDRLSNFLLWQSAYSEIYFVDKLWQDFTEQDLDRIIGDYNSRERRFGK
ncbi:MAG: polyprenyl diphosphate synthase [Candidatus Altiarchaeota archaeon]|nr:polyprenyl diphosphate synthase [Candidatus Altiarchaeota archaeon]